MKEENKKIKCWLCEEEHEVLMSIEVANESFFQPRQGVCWNCLRDGDWDDRLFNKSEKRVKEQIEGAEKNKRFWEEKLNELSTFNKGHQPKDEEYPPLADNSKIGL